MTDHMSAKDYQKLISGGNDGAMSDEDFHKAIADTGKAVKKPRNHEEDDLTIQVAGYCQILVDKKKIVVFSHIPQETFTKSWVVKNKNTAMGVRAGVPDMLIVYPDHILFLELKREDGGSLSDNQKFWIDAINKVGIEADSIKGSVSAAVACGWDEAKEIIDLFIN